MNLKPSKIVCIGKNYLDHAKEMGGTLPPDPLIFLKPPSAVIGHGEPIVLPKLSDHVEHEAEIGIVIQKRMRHASEDEAIRGIEGFVCLNDVTARDIQNKEIQYTRAKGFDTFGPIGPCIVTGEPGAVRGVECWVNGERRQQSTTEQLIFPVDYLVEYVSFVMTLEPGDIISTGTPSGVGPLVAGDVVTVTVEGVGELTNPVEAES